MSSLRLINRLPNEEIKEIDDFDSMVSDIFDPVEFTKSYIQVYNPTDRFFVPMIPYTYQEGLLRDESMRKFLLKSRQIGFSWIDAIGTLHKCITIPNYEKIYVSLRQDQASELVRNVKLALFSLPEKLQPTLVKDQERRIQLPNRARVTATSAKASATRGFHGDITFDEFAHLPNDKEMLEAAMAVAVREGFQITIGSTPFGKRGEFHRIAEECGWNTYWTYGRRADYRNLYNSFVERIDEGLYKGVYDPKFITDFRKDEEKLRKDDQKRFRDMVKRVQRSNNTIWSLHAASWFECPDIHYDQIVAATTDTISEKQEFFLMFVDDAASLITLEQIRAAADPELRMYGYEYCPPTQNRRIMGVDPASKINETAVSICEEEGQRWICRYIWSERGTKDLYVPHIINLFNHFNCGKVYVDETGMGGPVVEDLSNALGEGRVEGKNLTGISERERIVYNMTGLFQSKPPGVTIPYNERLMMQLHSLEMLRDKQGKPKFTGKIKSEDGQDDMVWALALSLYERANMASRFRYKAVDTQFLKPRKTVKTYGRR